MIWIALVNKLGTWYNNITKILPSLKEIMWLTMWFKVFQIKNLPTYTRPILTEGSPIYQNPRQASSLSRIFLFSLVYVFIHVFIHLCHASRPNEKRYRPEIGYTYSHRPYLKHGLFVFFEKIPVTAASLEKLPCHVDFPHISSIAF